MNYAENLAIIGESLGRAEPSAPKRDNGVPEKFTFWGVSARWKLTEREMSMSAGHERKADAKGESAVKRARPKAPAGRLKGKHSDRRPKAGEGNTVFTEHEMSASAERERNADTTRESIAKWDGGDRRKTAARSNHGSEHPQ